MKKTLFAMMFVTLGLCSCSSKNKDFIFVEGGTFLMGNDEIEEEAPAHEETVSSFYICKHEVTQGEWETFMAKLQNKLYEGDNMPLRDASWRVALEYCNRRSEAEGLTPCYSADKDGVVVCDFSANGYRLPTEAEWEYAAKGGNKSKGYLYSGSNDIDEVAWHATVKGEKSFIDDNHEVMTKKPNELGIYDMSGSVIELCWDEYASYDKSIEDDNLYTRIFTQRVLRGGSSTRTESRCTNTYRDYCDERSPAGFRLVRTSMKKGVKKANAKETESSWATKEQLQDLLNNIVKMEGIIEKAQDGKAMNIEDMHCTYYKKFGNTRFASTSEKMPYFYMRMKNPNPKNNFPNLLHVTYGKPTEKSIMHFQDMRDEMEYGIEDRYINPVDYVGVYKSLGQFKYTFKTNVKINGVPYEVRFADVDEN